MTESAYSTEINNGIGYQTAHDADDLNAFAFDRGERFVRWYPWGNERADDDVWAVTARSFHYTVTWVRERDSPPIREDHRVYTLRSRETFDKHRLTERELKRGDWRRLEDVDQTADPTEVNDGS